MTNINKIDCVLEIILNSQTLHGITDNEMSVELARQKLDISNKELLEILYKLEKDDFITYEVYNLSNIKHYFSTFGGRFFSDAGGYKSQNKSYKRKIIKDRFITTINVINIFAIIILTFFIYQATDKANDNKEEVKTLNSEIERLTKMNDSLVYIKNLKTIQKENKHD